MTTEEVPYIDIEEFVEPIHYGGEGARRICIMGKTENTKDLTTIHEFKNYRAAREVIGDPSTENELLQAITDVFEEGSINFNSQDQLGIDKVYAIDMGTDPQAADWEAAFDTSMNKFGIDIDLPVGCSDLTVMNYAKLGYEDLASKGMFRNAIFTHAEGATLSQIRDMTDTTKGSYIRSGRIHIKYLRNTQAKYAAKVAYTPYYQDPAYGAYRSMGIEDIQDENGNILTIEDADDMLLAGITCDWKANSPYNPSEEYVEPIRSVATNHREVLGEVPSDSNLHCRLNADYQWRQLVMIAGSFIKQNETATTLKALEEMGKAHLQGEVKKGYIEPRTRHPVDPGYYFKVTEDLSNPFKIWIDMKCRPVNAIYFIGMKAVVKAPV